MAKRIVYRYTEVYTIIYTFAAVPVSGAITSRSNTFLQQLVEKYICSAAQQNNYWCVS